MPEDAVRAVLAKHAQTLVSLPGVVGVAEGETGGRPCITVYVVEKTPRLERQVPTELEGWPVVVRESGEFRAIDD